mgnify:CR=1 FL=1
MTLDFLLSTVKPFGSAPLKGVLSSLNPGQFERRVWETYGISPNEGRYISIPGGMADYVSSLIMLDMLDRFFGEAGIELPQNPKALDIGSEDWHYVAAIHKFLKVRSGSDNIQLDGIEYFGDDYKGTIDIKLRDLDGTTYTAGDIFEISIRPEYDIVFVMHPLGTEKAYGRWKIPFRPLDQFWSRAMGSLKPGGILIGCGYLWCDGKKAFEYFPQDETILSKRYYSPLQRMHGINVFELRSFDDNIVMIAKKPG